MGSCIVTQSLENFDVFHSNKIKELYIPFGNTTSIDSNYVQLRTIVNVGVVLFLRLLNRFIWNCSKNNWPHKGVNKKCYVKTNVV